VGVRVTEWCYRALILLTHVWAAVCTCLGAVIVLVLDVTSCSRPGQRTVAAGTTVTAVALDPGTGYCWAGTAAGEVVVVRYVSLCCVVTRYRVWTYTCFGCVFWLETSTSYSCS
jgi:hypothetical protein